MGYAKISRTSAAIADTTKVISYTLYNGNNQNITVSNVDYAEMLIDDISNLLDAVGISNTVNKTTNRITIDDWGIDFLVSVYKSSTKYYCKIYQDGDYNEGYCAGGAGMVCNLITSTRFTYDLYIYTSDNNNFVIEISDGSHINKYMLIGMAKIPHPYGENKNVLMVCPFFPSSYGWTGSYGCVFKDMDDLTHCVMPALTASTEVIKAMPTINYIGTMFPDTSELNNINMKKLIWYDQVEIPDFYQLPTVVNQGTDFNDGTYKYHTCRHYDPSSAYTIRVAIRYGTVA